MKLKKMLKTSIITLMGTSLVACGSPVSLEEYQKFASAGQEYAAALDSLFVESGNYFVDSNSEILLRSDVQEPERDAISYSRITELDDEWLILIARIRQHTDLLKQYFLALENLATSNAPAEAKKATEQIFTELNSISNTIQKSSLISNETSSALSSVPEIILTQKIQGALREELEQRKETIYRELALQDLVLELLAIQLQKNLQIIRDSRDNRLTLPAYTAPTPISKPDSWIEQRRNIRTTTLSIEALNNAAQASEQFKEAFKLLLEDKFTIARANALLSDIEFLLTIVEDLKQANNSPSLGE